MTEEKARTTLMKIRLSGACFPEDNPESALDMAIEALAKQVPMKPEPETYFKHYSHQKKCPVCNDWLILEGGTKMKYCCTCGQAID